LTEATQIHAIHGYAIMTKMEHLLQKL